MSALRANSQFKVRITVLGGFQTLFRHQIAEFKGHENVLSFSVRTPKKSTKTGEKNNFLRWVGE